jgi:flagellar assembly protein FliH
MSSSKDPRDRIRNVPPPQGSAAKGNAYSRFIPREELDSFAAWQPGAFGDAATTGMGPAGDEPAAPAAPDPAELLRAARQTGYHDGYRDGLAGLESFKQNFAQQTTAQLGALMEAFGAQLDALHNDMARTLAQSATSLARQIVRSELTMHPEHVAAVARDAVEALMQSARHLSVRVHPDDHPLVAQGAAEVLRARGARLLSDASVARGGCIVDSDLGIVDASIEARWRRGAAALGSEAPWSDAGRAAAATDEETAA